MSRPGPVVSFDRPSDYLQYVLRKRRRGGGYQYEEVTEEGLDEDLAAAQTVFQDLLAFAEVMVKHAPRPYHFGGGAYLTNTSE